MNTEKWIFSLIISTAIITASCVTADREPEDIPVYSDAVENRIEELIADGEPEKAVQLIRSLEYYSGYDGSLADELPAFEDRAESLIREQYKESIERKDFLEAVEILRSAEAAGIEIQGSNEDLYLRYVEYMLEEEAVTPALSVVHRLIESDSVPVEKIRDRTEQLAEAALRNRDRVVLQFLMDNSLLETEEEIIAARKIIETPVRKEDMIGGTVTIWINKGIKIENGIGYPDIVIGSGFFIDYRGYILTNYHVIESEVDPEYEGFSRLYIKFDELEAKIPARVIGWDKSLDIALIKVEYEPDYIFTFPREREYVPGEKIFAIGSPGGLEKTITSGIISASGNRRLLPLGDTIQVDVPINSGNSGGPVVDEQGYLVGIVFAGIEQFEGVNFIIPVKWVIQSLNELYREGRNRQSWLGMTVHEDRDGLEIIYVLPGTDAYRTGISGGDRLVSIDGVKVKSLQEAQHAVMDRKPGSLISITTSDGEDNIEKRILSVENRADIPMKKALETDSRENLMSPFFGMNVETGEGGILEQEYIIKKVYRGMSAEETGLSVNDPFSIISWQINEKLEALVVSIRIKKRKAGFLETAIQIGSYLDLNNTL